MQYHEDGQVDDGGGEGGEGAHERALGYPTECRVCVVLIRVETAEGDDEESSQANLEFGQFHLCRKEPE